MHTTNMAPLDVLMEAARWAPSPDNMQPWRFLRRPDGFDVHFDATAAAGTTFPLEAEATQISLGAIEENLRQAAQVIGAEVQLHRHDSDTLRLRAEITTLPDPRRLETELPLFRRHTNRYPFRPSPVPDAVQAHVAAMHEPGAQLQLMQDKRQLQAWSDIVRRAGELRFQNMEIMGWLAHSLRFKPEDADHGDGLDIRTFDLPPGGTLMLHMISSAPCLRAANRVGAYKLLAAIEARPIAAGPLLIAILRDDNRDAMRAAGALMERAWITLNEAGLAVQPYYVVADQLRRQETGQLDAAHRQAALDLARRCQLQLGEQRPLAMLLRVGWPCHTVTRSQRKPLALMQTGA
ncbi:hypothetical protein ABWL39_10915 [Chitinivorax sp. PXF-14]|uniref:hypothetical protein n=1 Tax=Chitinivorax sp. PXF-14 TaxID=3230488 RepID=UPI003464F440